MSNILVLIDFIGCRHHTCLPRGFARK